MSIGYKVVGRDLCGRDGYQYAIGRTFVQEGKIQACANGLHYSCSVNAAKLYGQQLVGGGEISTPVRYLRVVDTESDPNYRDVKPDKVATRSLFISGELSLEEWQHLCEKENEQKAKQKANAERAKKIGFACFGVATIALLVWAGRKRLLSNNCFR